MPRMPRAIPEVVAARKLKQANEEFDAALTILNGLIRQTMETGPHKSLAFEMVNWLKEVRIAGQDKYQGDVYELLEELKGDLDTAIDDE